MINLFRLKSKPKISVWRIAEENAVLDLVENNFDIISTNWSTRYCEIDIIAMSKNTIYFIEVKYRKNSSQGYGLDYVDQKKQKQMKYAAELWISNNYKDTDENYDYCLAAIEVFGDKFEVSGLSILL